MAPGNSSDRAPYGPGILRSELTFLSWRRRRNMSPSPRARVKSLVRRRLLQLILGRFLLRWVGSISQPVKGRHWDAGRWHARLLRHRQEVLALFLPSRPLHLHPPLLPLRRCLSPTSLPLLSSPAAVTPPLSPPSMSLSNTVFSYERAYKSSLLITGINIPCYRSCRWYEDLFYHTFTLLLQFSTVGLHRHCIITSAATATCCY